MRRYTHRLLPGPSVTVADLAGCLAATAAGWAALWLLLAGLSALLAL